MDLAGRLCDHVAAEREKLPPAQIGQLGRCEVSVAGDRAKTVLVVDDDRDLLSLVSLVLEEEGFHVETAADGREGLEAVKGGMPNLILLDMKMPVMNGWEFAREFQSRYDSRAPIVVITASEDARKRAEEIGAAGWIGKPFDLDALVRVVRSHIDRR